MSIGVLFPGQGSQFVGMGADVFEVHEDLLRVEADAILGWSLRDVCLNGPEETLTRTEYAQPALFATSYALWLSFRSAFDGDIAGAAGHSLGEYTALCASGALPFVDALNVVSERGKAMAAAADAEPSGMAALIGASPAVGSEVVVKSQSIGGRLEVANINAPGQVVVSGSAADIEWVVANARELGVRRAIPLKVAGAFHSSFMTPAAAQVAAALAKVDFSEPSFDVWSNTDAEPHDPESMADTLTRQVVSTVRFSESLENMSDSGIDTFIHIGPGDVTAGMAKRTVEGATVLEVSSTADIPEIVESLATMA